MRLKFVFVICFLAGHGDLAAKEELILYRWADLETAKQRIAAGDEVVTAAFKDVIADARKWVRTERLSVMDKKLLPESGDRHDYLSLAPYWWPDPKSEDGLPYVRRDGVVNPESKDEAATDKERLLDFTGGVQTLALAWYFSGEKIYAEKAAEMLRVWFLEEETRMSPHLEYAQIRRGRKAGRSGVLEGRAFFRVLDASRILAGSGSWTGEDGPGLREWFSDYLAWLTESEMGRWEGESPNNHGTWYDAQVMGFALFVGEEEIAKKASKCWRGRWASQFEKNGAQPLELERTLSLDYSIFNLVAHLDAGRLAERLVEDPWAGGECPVEKGIEHIAPALCGESEWRHQQIKPVKSEPLLELVRLAQRAFPGAIDEVRVEALKPEDAEGEEAVRESRFQLLLPRTDSVE